MNFEGLKTGWLGRKLLYFDELESTNAYTKEHAAELPQGAAVIAKRQTKGRGRLERRWHGGDGGLFLTLLLREEKAGSTADLQALPLVAGLAVLRALESVTGESFKLKWSNDVLFKDKKLCGILCESRIGAEAPFVAVGIGVNLTGTREEFDRHDLVYATSLELATGRNIGNLKVAAEICNHFEPLLRDFHENGFDCLRQSYIESCVTIGREVRVIADGCEREAVALGVTGDGGLICNVGGKTEIIRAGEASVRGLYGYV